MNPAGTYLSPGLCLRRDMNLNLCPIWAGEHIISYPEISDFWSSGEAFLTSAYKEIEKYQIMAKYRTCQILMWKLFPKSFEVQSEPVQIK